MFNIEDYNYSLPEVLIAQVPAPSRDSSRLLVVKRLEESFSDHYFFDLPGLLTPGDLLVVNNTRVVPSRLLGRKETGGLVEILVLEHHDSDIPESNTRWCLLKSSKKPKKGNHLFFECNVSGRVEDLADDGLVQITFQGPLSIDALMEEKGIMPLPPYIKRERHDERFFLDRQRYQTVFSNKKGAIASPTAGLHFSDKIIGVLSQAGIAIVELTLHVGHGTFRPVRSLDIRDHKIGEEDYHIDPDTAKAINRAKKDSRRVIAVGTTVVRALETAAGPEGQIIPGQGKTDLFVTPGFQFRVVDSLITNFHLPKSSLLFLVSAFAGLELIRKAYHRAIEKRYRFYSYGDAMLII
ncbi:MAG: tRNA preQ1(34) S-adenosylmethionine ribosyltransferase-isomerase QueA [Thermodesulfobacteriota bacterium]|nr:tRNA preQ1(34) S-adenosylmethionine ribosyltransferase-isomerase QueA [Thermodesulfobacteriota bacterium]